MYKDNQLQANRRRGRFSKEDPNYFLEIQRNTNNRKIFEAKMESFRLSNLHREEEDLDFKEAADDTMNDIDSETEHATDSENEDDEYSTDDTESDNEDEEYSTDTRNDDDFSEDDIEDEDVFEEANDEEEMNEEFNKEFNDQNEDQDSDYERDEDDKERKKKLGKLWSLFWGVIIFYTFMHLLKTTDAANIHPGIEEQNEKREKIWWKTISNGKCFEGKRSTAVKFTRRFQKREIPIDVEDIINQGEIGLNALISTWPK